MEETGRIKGLWCSKPDTEGESGVIRAVRDIAIGVLAGSVTYFSLPVDLHPAIILGALVVLLGGFWGARGGSVGGFFLVTGLLSGLLSGHLRTQSIPCELDPPVGPQIVTGWLERVDRSASGRQRLYIRDEATGCRTRIVANPGEARLGERIRIRSMLYAPSRAAVPGAYDSRLPLFFQRVSRTGYAIGRLQLLADAGAHSLPRRLAASRQAISDRIRDGMPERNGAIAAALITGDRSHIHAEDAELLRAAGLGHILAISGLHMALVAGGVFFAVRALTALIPIWARRGNTATPAAIAALISACAYLVISGGSIPTQRAFLMTIAGLMALLLGRRVLSLHTLALAMIAVLLAQPESVISPGFQMSFAAAGALIATAELLRGRDRPNPLGTWPGVKLISGLSLTSLVAGSATAGFAAFHFHRMAQYGLPANLLAMPVVSFVVMPAGLLALCLMPIGAEGPALAIMSAGLDFVFWASDWVTSLPGALTPVHAAPGWVLLVYSAGFVMTVAMRNGLRLAGLGVGLIAILAWSVQPKPLVFVGERGDLLVRVQSEWVSRPGIEGGFDRRVFLERQGQTGVIVEASACDADGCRLSVQPLIIHSMSMTGLEEDCRRADLVVTAYAVPDWIERGCQSMLIDTSALVESGSYLIWIDRRGRFYWRTVDDTPRMRSRPWR